MKVTLIDVKVNKPGSNGEMTFTVTYVYELGGEVIESEMEVESPFSKNVLYIQEEKLTKFTTEKIMACNNVRIIEQKHKTLWKAEQKEMTVKEIEKQLGYPIKIVKG